MERKHRHAYEHGTFNPSLDNWTTIGLAGLRVVDEIRASCHPVESETVSVVPSGESVSLVINSEPIVGLEEKAERVVADQRSEPRQWEERPRILVLVVVPRYWGFR